MFIIHKLAMFRLKKIEELWLAPSFSWMAKSSMTHLGINTCMSGRPSKNSKMAPGSPDLDGYHRTEDLWFEVECSCQWIGSKEKLQENHGKSHISWENLWFPADFPLSQPIEKWLSGHSPGLPVGLQELQNHLRRVGIVVVQGSLQHQDFLKALGSCGNWLIPIPIEQVSLWGLWSNRKWCISSEYPYSKKKIFPGWWYSYSSEKYELWWLVPTEWENKTYSKPPTRICLMIPIEQVSFMMTLIQ